MVSVDQLEKKITTLEKIINILLEKNNINLTFCPDCGENCDDLSNCSLCKNVKCFNCLARYTECSSGSGSIFDICKDCENCPQNEYYKYK